MRAPGFYSDVPAAEYHDDRLTLSHSGAKLILKSPAHFRHALDHPGTKDVFDFGQAAHALVLGVGLEDIYVAPYANWQTKAAQTERKLARVEGLTPILPADWLVVCDMADELSRHRLAMELLSDGKPEVSAYAVDDATGVIRRCRFDYLRDDYATDYKSSFTSEPREFIRAAARFGYHQQHPWYLDVARDLGHGAKGFLYIVQEKEPPYVVTVVELPPDLVDAGRERNQAALQRFRDCTESNLWPGYVPDDQIATGPAPGWALYNDLEVTA